VLRQRKRFARFERWGEGPLTTLLAAKGIVTSPKPHLTSHDYALLSLFFGVLVVVAPWPS
jgi:hypothetical protein